MEKLLKTILIIEDDFELWEDLLNQIFPAEEQFEIISNQGNYNVSEILQSKNKNLSDIDLVISDYFLGNKNGVQWINDNIKNKDALLPVMFWTSSMDVNIIRETTLGEKVFFKKKLELSYFKDTATRLIFERKSQQDYPLYNEYFNLWIKSSLVTKRKYKFRKLCHFAYTNASRYLEGFFGHSKYHTVFNTHGLLHAQNVLKNLSKLLLLNPDYFKNEDGPEDFYFVIGYMAALLHDLGMIPDKYDEKIEFSFFKQTRKDHCKRISYWILSGQLEEMLAIRFQDFCAELAGKVRTYIALICLYHDGNHPFSGFGEPNVLDELKQWAQQQDYDTKGFFEEIDTNEIIRDEKLKTLSGLVALADKLDYNISRVPVGPAREGAHRGLMDEFEYVKNECFHSFKIINSYNGPCVKILVKRPNIDFNKSINEQDYFEQFVSCIDANEGRIKDTAIYIAGLDAINTIDTKWDNIKNSLKACSCKYLSRLTISFDFVKRDHQKFKIPSSIFIRDENNIEFVNTEPKLNSYEKALLQHVFGPQYKKVRLTQISAGFSGEKVFQSSNVEKVVKDDICYSTQNKIIKIGDYNRIHTEYKNFYNIAFPYLNSRSLIGFVEEFKYLNLGAIEGSLITNEGIVESLHEHVFKKPEFLTEAIAKSLNIFYEKIKPIENQTELIIGKYHFLFKKNLDKLLNSDLSPYYKCSAKKEYEKILSLLKNINEKPIQLSASYIHGDFTFRNILVDSNEEFVFIDFAESDFGHYCLDFAKLDHYIRHELLNHSNISFDNGTLVKFEESIIDGKDIREPGDYFERAYAVSTIIVDNMKKLLISSHPDLEINHQNIGSEISIGFNLAKLYVNFWSLTYTKEFALSFEDRLEIVKLYRTYIEKHL